MSPVVRVLVVDDSAFVRKVVREMLSRNPHLEVVGAARDGVEALEMAHQLQPDVVTCDLQMPRLDGVGFVREQMSRRPVPILLLSATPEDGSLALDALDAGAIDFIQKPSALATNDLLNIRYVLRFYSDDNMDPVFLFLKVRFVGGILFVPNVFSFHVQAIICLYEAKVKAET